MEMEFFCTVKFNHFMWPNQFIKIFASVSSLGQQPLTTHTYSPVTNYILLCTDNVSSSGGDAGAKGMWNVE